MTKQRKHKKKKVLWVMIGIIVVLIAVVCLFSQRNGNKGKVTQNLTTTELKLSELEDTISASGSIQSNKSVNVTSQLSYKIKKVYVDLGETVKKGDTLAEFDTADLKQAVQDAKDRYDSSKEQYDLKVSQAKQALNSAKDSVSDCKSDLADAKDTYASAMGAVKGSKEYKDRYQDAEDKDQLTISAKQSLTSAENNLTQAQNNYDNTLANDLTTDAKSQLDTAKDNLKDAVVKAPMDGVITAVNVSENNALSGSSMGSSSTSSTGTGSSGTLFTIDDDSSFIVSASVADYDVIKMKLKKEVKITVDSTGDIYQGKILTISPVANSSGNYDFTASIDTDSISDIRSGMSTTVKIIIEKKENIYVVPVDSIVEKNGKKYVVALNKQDSGNVKKTNLFVTTGMETDYYVEVTGEGLKEGLNILNDPLNKLKVSDSSKSSGAFFRGGN